MRKVYQVIAVSMLLAASQAVMTTARAVETEPSDIEDHLRAKKARIIAKQNVQEQSAQGSTAEKQNKSKCGVDIGNVVGQSKINPPKEVTVVITGDVINTGNKCKK